MKGYSEQLLEALRVIAPARLRLLADFIETQDQPGDGTEVQDDLRKMADLAEAALARVEPGAQTNRVREYSVKIISGAGGTEHFDVRGVDVIEAMEEVRLMIQEIEIEKPELDVFQLEIVEKP